MGDLQIRQGRNVWRILRTDRDGASDREVADMVGPAVYKFLRGFGLIADEAGWRTEPWELVIETPEGQSAEWRFGDVRPLRVLSVTQAPADYPAMPAGAVLGSRMALPGELATVRGERPFAILVELWWRAAPVAIEWPGYTVSGITGASYSLQNADWLLDRAVFPVDQGGDPGGSTWGDAVAADVLGTMRRNLPAVAIGVGGWMLGAALAYLAIRLLVRKGRTA